MDWTVILFAVVTMSSLGLLFGSLLAIAAGKFAVEVDPRVEQILDILPGSNCGACGYPGCEAAAEVIAEGKAAVDACIAGGSEVAEEIGKVLGVEVDTEKEPVKPVLLCGASIKNTNKRFEYSGLKDCQVEQLTTKGSLQCSYGCLNYNSCVDECPFNALFSCDEETPYFKYEKCTSCGICITTCPRDIIQYIPEKAKIVVLCSSKDKGKVVRKACKVGCIACGACVKVCETGAIQMVDNLAVIDYDKCDACQKCVDKCPTKCIVPIELQGNSSQG